MEYKRVVNIVKRYVMGYKSVNPGLKILMHDGIENNGDPG